jgi:hypothetical protein
MSKKASRKIIFKIRLMVAILFVLVTVPGVYLPQNAFCGSAHDREEKAVIKAARTFLDAEIRRDYPAVYACFASSSAYVRTPNSPQYLADAKVAPDRIVTYQIIRVSYIKDNKDFQTISTADKIAQVEVEVTFAHEGTNRQSVVNIGFIFLKEGGKWYKS